MASRRRVPARALRLSALLPLALGLLASVLPAPAGAQGRDYRIGPQDVLKVTVWEHDELTRTVPVTDEGTILFPLLGEVRVGGLTVAQAEARLRELLDRDFVIDPRVSVTVQEYRSQRVFVLGEAAKPGIYTLTGTTTLLDVLSQAGGPTASAGAWVTVTRAANGPSPAPGAGGLRVSLKQLADGDPAANVRLSNGDTIFIPKMTSFFVLGEVQRQGAFAMDREITVLEAITLAGGFTDRAAPSGAKILRKRPDGPQATIEVNLSGADPRARELPLVEGDTLVVPRGNVFFVAGEVRKPGVYQLDASTTAFGAISLAGGLTERAAPGQGKLIRRLPSGEEQTTLVDLSGGDPRARELALRDGDTLLIPAGDLFFVLGEVNKPGAFQLVGQSSIIDGILMAGGFTTRAAANRVKVVRRLPTGEEHPMLLDLATPNTKGRDIPLVAGDTVMVPAGGSTFYVLGAVKAPGSFQLQDGATAIQAIAMAGGFTGRAAQTRVRVIRTHDDGRQETLVVDLAQVIKDGRKDKDIPIAANDVIVVPERFF
jgi:polysaccharide export outer membrane protein